ncbi:MAG: hypothetical protein COB75_08470, partial [Idiomarina sp.]
MTKFLPHDRLTQILCALAVLICVFDFSTRLLINSQGSYSRNILADVKSMQSNVDRSTAEELKALLSVLDPPEPEKKANDKKEQKRAEPTKPKGPTKEEKINRLVDGGAKRLGAEIVYLRGVVIDESAHALLVRLDDDLKERAITLQVGEQLGDYTLEKINSRGVLFTASGNS